MSCGNAMRIVMAQLNLLVGDIEGNAARVIEAARRARDELQAQLVVFPELTLTAYPPEDLLLREGLYRRVEAALERIRNETHGITVVLGYPAREQDCCYNMAACIRDGEVLAVYRKQLLPNYSVFDEKRYFHAGSEACVVDVHGVRLGITICEDAWSPGPIGQARDAGAQMIVNLNASPWYYRKGREREQAIRERVAESGCPVLYVNLVGGQDELVFDGESFVMNAQGEVVCRAPAFEEGLFVADIDIVDGAPVPCAGELVEPLDEEAGTWRALVCGVRDYIDKNGFRGAVIGLSGGIDSALTLAIAVDALGPERVEAVSMPSRYTADMSIEDARDQAERLGVRFDVIAIEPVFRAFLDSLSGRFAGLPADTTEENIQARCRGIILMAISNKTGLMVLTTGNKSEMAVGYATLYGDMAGGYAVLKDVPKTLVYRLAEYRNGLGEVIPRRVIERPPSAELAPDQKDEDSLPPYEILDPIIEMFVERDLCAEEIIAQGYAPETVHRVIRMIIRNEYKRRQAPPGIKVTQRAFGKDRRYPITSGFFKTETR